MLSAVTRSFGGKIEGVTIFVVKLEDDRWPNDLNPKQVIVPSFSSIHQGKFGCELK